VGCLILEAFSVSYGKASPYLPVIELLKNYFRFNPRMMNAVGAKSDWQSPGAGPQPRRHLALLLCPVGVEDLASRSSKWTPRIRRRRTFEAIKKLFLRESLNQAADPIFEDLHWLDSETKGVWIP